MTQLRLAQTHLRDPSRGRPGAKSGHSQRQIAPSTVITTRFVLSGCYGDYLAANSAECAACVRGAFRGLPNRGLLAYPPGRLQSGIPHADVICDERVCGGGK